MMCSHYENWKILGVDDDTVMLEVFEQTFASFQTQTDHIVGNLSDSVDRLEVVGATGEMEVTLAVETAVSGEEGYQKVCESVENNQPYSVVLLDMHMPNGWDGLKTAEEILKVDPSIHIVFLTAYDEHSPDQIRKKIGLQFHYVSKPFIEDDLKQTVISLANNWYQQRELANYRKKLEQAVQQAEEANQAKDQFLASMSHELRTPLASILGNGEMLAEYVSDQEGKELLDAIALAGRTQLALVNDILDLSKIGSGKFEIDPTPFELTELLHDIELLFSSRLNRQGINFTIQQSHFPVFKIWGDSHRLKQILSNLLSNAAKFTQQGFVKVDCRKVDEMLLFSVEDSGIGIAAEAVGRLFQPFEQADRTIGNRFGGTGLGLSISKSLAEMMGGTIDVESVEGKGSSFTLSIPYKESELSVESKAKAVQQDAELRFQGHVLLAEDAIELQLLGKKILERSGVTVTLASNGQEAVELAQNNSFDLILMDMQMPLMDGLTATQQLRDLGGHDSRGGLDCQCDAEAQRYV